MVANVLQSIVIVTTYRVRDILGIRISFFARQASAEESFMEAMYATRAMQRSNCLVRLDRVLQIRVVAACKWLTCGAQSWGRSFLVSGQARHFSIPS